MSTTADAHSPETLPRPLPAPKAGSRDRRLTRLGLGASLVFALAGWGAAGYLWFVAIPEVATTHKVAYTLELVDHFGDSPAHDVYMQLSDDMKPWWDQIDGLQRQIAATTDDEAREKLINQRDQTLITFIHEHYLSNRIDMLINAFSPFKRCLDIDACDEDAMRKSIAIDIKRIYRTFRPYIEAVRAQPRKDDFGRDLEALFLRFVG